MDPDEQSSHFAMGVTLLQTGHPFQARRHLREALRIDPDPDAEEMYLHADKSCRWIGLPMYLSSLWISRIPGSMSTVWVGVLTIYFTTRQFAELRSAAETFLWCYVAFVVYTWVASPLTEAWVKFRPPA